METAILFAISVLMSLIIWNKISKEYLWPRVKDRELKKAVQPVLILHSFRFAGLSFLMPGIVRAGLNPCLPHLAISQRLFWLLQRFRWFTAGHSGSFYGYSIF
jgi:hypothetical protein